MDHILYWYRWTDPIELGRIIDTEPSCILFVITIIINFTSYRNGDLIDYLSGILNMMLGWGTYSGQFTYSITEVFYYITVVLIFVFYLLLVFTFYIFTSQGDRTYRRVRYNDPAVDNLLEIVSNEL